MFRFEEAPDPQLEDLTDEEFQKWLKVECPNLFFFFFVSLEPRENWRGSGLTPPALTLLLLLTLMTGPTRSLSLKLGDTRVYEPQIRARLGTAAQGRTPQLLLLLLLVALKPRVE